MIKWMWTFMEVDNAKKIKIFFEHKGQGVAEPGTEDGC